MTSTSGAGQISDDKESTPPSFSPSALLPPGLAPTMAMACPVFFSQIPSEIHQGMAAIPSPPRGPPNKKLKVPPKVPYIPPGWGQNWPKGPKMKVWKGGWWFLCPAKAPKQCHHHAFPCLPFHLLYLLCRFRLLHKCNKRIMCLCFRN